MWRPWPHPFFVYLYSGLLCEVVVLLVGDTMRWVVEVAAVGEDGTSSSSRRASGSYGCGSSVSVCKLLPVVARLKTELAIAVRQSKRVASGAQKQENDESGVQVIRHSKQDGVPTPSSIP